MPPPIQVTRYVGLIDAANTAYQFNHQPYLVDHPLSEGAMVSRFLVDGVERDFLDLVMLDGGDPGTGFSISRARGMQGMGISCYQAELPASWGGFTHDRMYQVLSRRFQEGRTLLWDVAAYFGLESHPGDLPLKLVIHHNFTGGPEPDLTGVGELLQNNQVKINWFTDDICRLETLHPIQLDRSFSAEGGHFIEIPQITFGQKARQGVVASFRVYLPRFPSGVENFDSSPWQSLQHGLDTFLIRGEKIPRSLGWQGAALLTAGSLAVFTLFCLTEVNPSNPSS